MTVSCDALFRLLPPSDFWRSSLSSTLSWNCDFWHTTTTYCETNILGKWPPPFLCFEILYIFLFQGMTLMDPVPSPRLSSEYEVSTLWVLCKKLIDYLAHETKIATKTDKMTLTFSLCFVQNKDHQKWLLLACEDKTDGEASRATAPSPSTEVNLDLSTRV